MRTNVTEQGRGEHVALRGWEIQGWPTYNLIRVEGPSIWHNFGALLFALSISISLRELMRLYSYLY